jgi:hypothetical protein
MSKSLNEKLFLLQQEIGTISKDATNPFYQSKYFDINSLIKQLQPLLQEHRLLLLQPIIDDMVLSQIICIDSNEAVVSRLKLPEINDPQKLGSAITYYRRYTLGSLLGLQSVDDDANLAIQASTSKRTYKAINKLEHLSKDRFDKAIVAYKSDPEGVRENLRKFTLDQVQINILKQNKITL